MSRIRWSVTLSVILVLGAVALAACGGSTGGSSTPASSEPSGSSTSAETTASSAAGGTESAGAQQVEKLKVNTASASVQWSDLYVAIDQGFFADHGLDVTPILSKSEPGTVLLSGQAEITTGSPTSLYIADAQGANIKAVYSMGATYVAWMAEPDISGPADLEGKKLGVFSLQDLDVYYTTQMMDQYGISPDSYQLLAVGPSADKLAAVKAGSVATAPLYPPTNFQAQNDGLHQIFDTSQLKSGALPGFYIVRQEWGQEHRAEVVNYLKALNEAHDWLFDPANRAAAIKIIGSHTGLPKPEVEASYDLFFTKPGLNYSKAGEWNPGAVKNFAPSMVKLDLIKKAVPYDSVVDLSYLQAATSGS